MKVFVAGATGVIGRSLVPQLIDAGHVVTAMTRNPNRTAPLAALGAKFIACDVYDEKKVAEAIRGARPEVVIHELTALPHAIDPAKIEEHLAENDRIRVEGTRNLVRAAALGGARRIVVQSVSFAYAPKGGWVKDENASLWLDAPWPWRRTVEAVAELERQVTSTADVEGVVLRYGYLYGPGTAYAADGSVAALVRERQFPIVDRGSGVFSFVHVGDAASATVAALDHGRPGVYNIVDDEPSPLREWLPVYATAIEAPEPETVTSSLAGLKAGDYGLYYMSEQRGAANRLAKRELCWSPRFATWRTGFRKALRDE